MREGTLQRFWLPCLIGVGLWMVVGLVDAGQTYLLRSATASGTPWWSALLLGVSDWYVWAVLTPFIFWLASRYPLESRQWRRRLLLHGVASMACAFMVFAVDVPIAFYARFFDWRHLPRPGEFLRFLLANKFAFFWLTYWLILGVHHGLVYYRKYQERALQAAQLESQLAQTQLQVLKMQLDPHFLFNTLHAISALMHQDVELADRMLAQLGALLRSTLENAGRQLVSLHEELEFIKPYLEFSRPGWARA